MTVTVMVMVIALAGAMAHAFVYLTDDRTPWWGRIIYAGLGACAVYSFLWVTVNYARIV
jgi:uncharacterized membrane protein YuzA (DUF378 family)